MKIFFTRIIRFFWADNAPDEIKRARQLIKAVDKGGIPLNPMAIRRIAEGLGLEVARNAPVEQTIERIRAALRRSGW